MDSFYRTHAYLIEHINAPVRRYLMDEIDWNDRLIGIKGTRGIGKTTFLLQYAKEHFGLDPSCLYINMNNFYFTGNGLKEFVDQFVNNGGKVLLIDQVFKYTNWSKDIRYCYDNYPTLKIIFTGSSVMRLKKENTELRDIVKSYNLRGFSFREFLNLQTGMQFQSYTLDDIIANHKKIAKGITLKVKPTDFLTDYIHHGFYPFFLEKRNFSENLLKTMNMMIEVDILLIKQIELKYLSKIKKLLYLLAVDGPQSPNVSQLAKEIETSRATVMNYIKYLADARLINMFYPKGSSFPKKPSRILMQNSNLIYSIYPMNVKYQDILNTFLANTLWKDHKVNKATQRQSLLIDETHIFRVLTKDSKIKKEDHVIYAIDQLEIGEGNQIPLWLFGFLY
ncbi:MAG: AAA family ATPase [Bacteroides sp.]|nr:AAA family ATPase [Bacteroides sp.]MDD2645542.1 AAA family ATPase [Bacteroides sp.]MDD4055069.1 AAA family ATPase [Bacteroides sp.]MDD4720120.1 AAA family ATPase [Bacteroides sp.]NLI64463.1 ATP-binding protein [Bacteroidales bacterium]